MNGAALAAAQRLSRSADRPAWYGIANVKWLKRIEVSDRRLENRFMGRDYVTSAKSNAATRRCGRDAR